MKNDTNTGLKRSNVQNEKSGRVLIVGVDSQIGAAARLALMRGGFSVKGTTRRKNMLSNDTYFFDLAEPSFQLFDEKFDVMLICAGITSIAKCEADPEGCETINVINTIKLIDHAAEKNVFAIFLSSDAVFDGSVAFSKYADAKNPRNLYGKHKDAVETHIENAGIKSACVLRLTKVISKDTPFIKNWENDAAAGLSINAFGNSLISPVTIDQVVDAIQLLANRKRAGIYQLGGSEELSYFEFAKTYFRDSAIAFNVSIARTERASGAPSEHHSLTTNLPTKEPQYIELLEVARHKMGLMSGHAYLQDPKRLSFTLARYKFVSKMFSGFDSVLEVGCADAFGSPIVLKEVQKLVACDFDAVFIDDAKRNHPYSKEIKFEFHNMVENPMAFGFEGVFSLDVLEHISQDDEDAFMRNICFSLKPNGACIIGMPSEESQVYASEISRLGHVNCKRGLDLKKFLMNYFARVFVFSMNDEVVHTGYQPMAQYLLALCCGPLICHAEL